MMMANVKKPSDILNKKMPVNPRYQHVKPVVDTGSSLRKYLELVEDIRKNFKYKKDEVFKRIKITTLVNLMVEVTKLRNLKMQLDEENQGKENEANLLSLNFTNKNESELELSPRKGSSHSTLQSVIMGVGEMDIDEIKHNSPDKKSMPIDTTYEDSLLLLDVRDQDEFSRCHILSAGNYPSSMLARTMNFESQNLFKFKNQPGKIIVFYDEEELRAPKVATTFVQRGYDNIYMLSGGLKYAAEKFPQGLITGVLPQSCQTARKTTRKATLNAEPFFQSVTENALNGKNMEILEQQLRNLFIQGNGACGMTTPRSMISSASTVKKLPGSAVSKLTNRTGNSKQMHRSGSTSGKPQVWK